MLETDDAVAAQWAPGLELRVREIQSGAAELVDAEAVFAELDAILKAP